MYSIVAMHNLAGPEEAQGLQRFWPLHYLACKFLNLSIMLTCHVMCSLHKLLCILVLCIVYSVNFDYTYAALYQFWVWFWVSEKIFFLETNFLDFSWFELFFKWTV